jgi:orotate phosphoribosyltransferase
MGKRYLFLEKIDDKLALRRNFKLAEGERVVIVEDVITRGGRVREALDIVQGLGCEVAAVAVLVDRSCGKVDFGVPFPRLVDMSFPTYELGALPPELEALPPVKPGS